MVRHARRTTDCRCHPERRRRQDKGACTDPPYRASPRDATRAPAPTHGADGCAPGGHIGLGDTRRRMHRRPSGRTRRPAIETRGAAGADEAANFRPLRGVHRGGKRCTVSSLIMHRGGGQRMAGKNRWNTERVHPAFVLLSSSTRPRHRPAGIILLHQLSEGGLEEVGREIDDLATDPDAFFAARTRAARSRPTIDPRGSMVNQLFHRWRDGTVSGSYTHSGGGM